MTARTFGRRGISDAGIVSRRAGLLGAAPAPAPAVEADELAARRAAFLSREHDRADEIEREETLAFRVTPAAVSEAVWGKPKSLPLAYALWLALGLVGAHRFYLGRYITGAMQAVLGTVSIALLVAGWLPAYLGLMIGLTWMSADTFYIGKMLARPPGGSLFG